MNPRSSLFSISALSPKYRDIHVTYLCPFRVRYSALRSNPACNISSIRQSWSVNTFQAKQILSYCRSFWGFLSTRILPPRTLLCCQKYCIIYLDLLQSWPIFVYQCACRNVQLCTRICICKSCTAQNFISMCWMNGFVNSL